MAICNSSVFSFSQKKNSTGLNKNRSTTNENNEGIPESHFLQSGLYFLAKIWDLCAWETNPDCQGELLAYTYQKNSVS